MTGEANTIGDILRHFAGRLPEAPAILAPGREPLTFRDLGRQAEYVRETLNGWGIGRGDRVAIVVPDRPEMAVAFLTVSSCATPAPLNPEYTANEFEHYLSNARAKALVVSEGNDTPARTVAERLGLTVIDLMAEQPSPAGMFKLSGGHPAAANQPGPAQPKDIAVVLPTSGTTSAPKVVPLCNARWMDMARRNTRWYSLDPNDQCVNIMPLIYHHSLNAALVLPLSAGCSVVLPSHFDAKEFFETLQAFSPTWYTAGPTHHQEIASHVANYEDVIAQCRLRFIRASSGRLPENVLSTLETAFGVPVIEQYGMTEVHGTVTINPLPPARRKPGAVGVPLANEVRIVDQDGNFLVQGKAGEVVVRGPCVFGGYENNPKANAEAFFDGWFRTGDEGVFDEDGYLTLTGRIKEVINRGGEKVSPSEVDMALMDHPDVIEAATFPIPHPTLGEEVAAAVVKEPGSILTDQDLTRFLLDKLSGFKVPRRFVFVDEIPKSDAGKVERYKLAEALSVSLDLNPAKRRKSKRRPTPLESRMLWQWQYTLRNSRIGLDDNFFLLGGDSLLAEELILQIERLFKCRLPAATLYKAGTVAEMAALIIEDETEGMEPQGAMVPIQPDGERPPFFCVHARMGGVIFLYPLSQHLGADQPLYGIQPVGWDPATVPFTKANDMAAHYVAEIRKIQPQGPYFIGGYSFGGRVAVYIARQLRAAGEEVAFLGLFDTASCAGRHYVTLGQWLASNEAHKGAKRLEAALRYVRARGHQQVYDRVLRTVLFPVLEFYRASGKPLPLPLCRPDRCNRLMRIEHRNMPTYEGDAVYFKAEADSPSMSHPDTRDSWHRIIKGRLNYIQVSGTHLEMMREPHVQSLATKLAQELKRARQK